MLRKSVFLLLSVPGWWSVVTKISALLHLRPGFALCFVTKTFMKFNTPYLGQPLPVSGEETWQTTQ